MTTPTIVTRIQNRRGTQAQFDSLYPTSYTSAPGATSVGEIITIADTTGLYVNAIPKVTAGIGQFAPGTYIVSVDSPTEFVVNIPPVVPLSGGATVVSVEKYNGVGGVLIAEYPNILLPGEFALCTDTRQLYLGNINGEYITVQGSASSVDLVLSPVVVVLPPSGVYADIDGIKFDVTPFRTLYYSVSDSLDPDWNTVGSLFSQNGELKVTAIDAASPPPPDPGPPYPTPTNVNLTDTSTAVNSSGPYNISFKAIHTDLGASIQIQYMHDFPGDLTFSTGSLIWLPFI